MVGLNSLGNVVNWLSAHFLAAIFSLNDTASQE